MDPASAYAFSVQGADDLQQRLLRHTKCHNAQILVIGWKPEMHFMLAGLDIFAAKARPAC